MDAAASLSDSVWVFLHIPTNMPCGAYAAMWCVPQIEGAGPMIFIGSWCYSEFIPA